VNVSGQGVATGQAERILILEYCAGTRLLQLRTFAGGVHRHSVVSDILGVLQVARTLRPHVALVDYYLPPLDFMALMEGLEAEGVPVITREPLCQTCPERPNTPRRAETSRAWSPSR
jgi:hypothetical protein